MSKQKYVPSAKEQAFLDTVESPRYERESINGLRPFFDEKMPEDMKGFYTEEELVTPAVMLIGKVEYTLIKTTKYHCRLKVIGLAKIMK